MPETAGGLMPKISLGYSSQSVDGRTSATNNQASWIGGGWDYNPGSITRTYANCREDSKKEGSNNKTHRTADLCWGSDNATLSLGGMTTELVWDKAQGKWFTANGDGSKIERLTDAGTTATAPATASTGSSRPGTAPATTSASTSCRAGPRASRRPTPC